RPLYAEHQLERLAGNPVVPVRGDLPPMLGVYVPAQRAHPHRRGLRPSVPPRAGLDRHRGDGPFHAAHDRLHHVVVVADIRQRLGERRDLGQRGRADPLARAPARAARVLPAVRPGNLGADQARRVPARTHSRPAREARRPGPRADAGARQRAGVMMSFLTANIAPLMFAALVVFLLLGYPVTFALGAIGLFFGFVGIELGLLTPALFGALPERIFGIL